jgi:hypothetical protein
MRKLIGRWQLKRSESKKLEDQVTFCDSCAQVCGSDCRVAQVFTRLEDFKLRANPNIYR